MATAPPFRFGLTDQKLVLWGMVIMAAGQLVLMVALKNEWHHLVPYSVYDFRPGYHPHLFGY